MCLTTSSDKTMIYLEFNGLELTSGASEISLIVYTDRKLRRWTFLCFG